MRRAPTHFLARGTALGLALLGGGGVNLRRHPPTKLPRLHKGKYKEKIFGRLWSQEYIGTWDKGDPLVTYPYPGGGVLAEGGT